MVQNRATHLNKSTTFKKVVAKAVDQKLPGSKYLGSWQQNFFHGVHLFKISVVTSFVPRASGI